jgi:hypothetical protein
MGDPYLQRMQKQFHYFIRSPEIIRLSLSIIGCLLWVRSGSDPDDRQGLVCFLKRKSGEPGLETV